MPYGIGVDFGGTKVLAGVVDLDSGEVLATAKKRTNAADDTDQMMKRVVSVIEDATDKAKLKRDEIEGIGVGLAGQIDTARGILLGAPNLSQSTVNLPMADLLSSHFGIPTFLRNDVQVAAIGEAAFGAGKASDNFVCVFVGTGIGGAIVRNGKLESGASGSAGEVGHMVIHANGRLCGCGGRGHLEAYASRTAITKAILGEIHRGRASVVTKLMEESGDDETASALRSSVLNRALEAGDGLTEDIVHEASMDLGYGLASVINLLNPAMIILGGGVIEAVDRIFKVAERTARRQCLATPEKAVTIVPAGLGDNAGVVGAALLNRL
ncbi:MAG TPA: ROK family protein [Thermomicrobiales bacterium]|nr:ROK family protein [Thermomicrobiales bacterium]HRA46638.1 ROK family protein [Thermomicrobiales bacterium]